MKLHLGTDHGAFELKQKVKQWLTDQGHEVVDHGAHELDMEDHYVDFIFPAAKAVAADKESLGIVFGGSGQGEAMAANRIKGVRAAVFYSPATPAGAIDAEGNTSDDEYEILKLTRAHNHSNVLSIGGRFMDFETVKMAIDTWMSAPVSDVERHVYRVQELDKRT